MSSSKRRRTMFLGMVFMAMGWEATAKGDPITTFQGALEPTTPAPGWSYLYNGGGAIGNPANYTPLVATTAQSGQSIYYDETGSNGLPGPAPGSYVYFGLVLPGKLNAGQAGGHPGEGSGNAGSGGIERYAIAAYTLGEAGTASISNSLLTNADYSAVGLDVAVYVDGNPTPFFSGSTSAGQGQMSSFDTSLGLLNAGDTIYVAIGSSTDDLNDSFSLDNEIDLTPNAVPEPTSIALCGIAGLIGLVGVRTRRKSDITRVRNE